MDLFVALGLFMAVMAFLNGVGSIGILRWSIPERDVWGLTFGGGMGLLALVAAYIAVRLFS